MLTTDHARQVHRSKPISEQIRAILRQRIREGCYGADGRFPSEASLAAEFGASRATVRTALAALAAEGLLFRRDGVGTFVAPEGHRLEAGLERLESVLALAARECLQTQAADVSVESIQADGQLIERLQVAAGTSVTRVRRTILIDGKPGSHQVDFVLAEVLGPSDVNETFTGSVLDLLLQREAARLSTAIAEVTAVSAGRKLGQLLKVPSHAPLLLINEIVMRETGAIVGCSDNYFVPDQFRFRVIRRRM